MAVGVFAVVVVAALAYAYFAMKGQPEQENMKPEGLDAFRVTYNQEGMPVPLTFGVVRVPGNLLWYGNLVTKEITEDVGGKGGGGGDVTTGYKYYLDHWQAVCLGPAYCLAVYVDNKPWFDDGTITAGTYTWYASYWDAQSIYTPTTWYNVESTGRTFNWSCGNIAADDIIVSAMQAQIGEYASRLEGVAFAWFDRFLCGENRAFLPTIHFVVERYSEVPFTNANMSNGTNPAAIIYELLIRSGSQPSEFDIDSFQAAATYWYSKGYGLNMTISEQLTCREAVQKVFNYVDGILSVDDDDRFVLKAFTEDDTSEATIETNEFKSFNFERPSWDDVYSDFRGEYTDETKEFSKRGLRVINSAVRSITGYSRQMTVNLSAFRDADTASKRLWEIARKQSYPASTIQFTTGLEYFELRIGAVITIVNSDYGISNAKFRILSKDTTEVDKNEVSFTCGQFLEGLFLDTYVPAANPEWIRPDHYASPAVYAEFFELPFNPITGNTLAWVALVQRGGVENGFLIRQSVDGNNYYTHGAYSGWSIRCNLDVEYPATSYDIDDENGLILTADYGEDEELFLNQSRTDLFLIYQVAIAGNEIMAFQYYQPYGSTQIKLTGVIRGLWNTPIETHSVNDKVWLTRLSSNIITGLNTDAADLKVLPYFDGDYMTDDMVSAYPVVITNKSLIPWPVGNIRAVRSGTTITVTWWTTPQTYVGAGATGPTVQTDTSPMNFDGDFDIIDTLGDANDQVAGNTKQFVQSGGVATTTVTVKTRVDAVYSETRTVYVDTSDGTYWG